MTRRDAIAIVALSVSTLAFRSCQEEKNQLAIMTETLGEAMAKLADAIGQTDFAARLRSATALVVGALRAWTPGQSAAEIIRNLNRIIDMIQGLPALDRFRPLVNFALGTIAAIIEHLQRAGGGGDNPHTPVRITAPPQTDRELRQDWDSIRAGSPGMEQAPVL